MRITTAEEALASNTHLGRCNMESKAKLLGHPIHPMLVPLPIGLWIFSLICDLVFAANGNAQWQTTAFFTLGGGIVGAVVVLREIT